MRSVPVIYVDLLFATNFVIDGLLLLLTAWFRSLPCRPLRLLLAAGFGAIVSLSVLLPVQSTLLRLVFQLIGAAGMTAILCSFGRFRDFAVTVAALYAVLMMYCGVLYALWLFFSPRAIMNLNGMVACHLTPLQLVVLTAASYTVLWLGKKLLGRTPRGADIVPVTLSRGGRTVRLRALSDSGHSLTEPLSGLPVLVVEEQAVQQLFTQEERVFLSHFSETLPEQQELLRSLQLRMIPYHTVGKEGVLPSFRPEHLWLGPEKQQTEFVGYAAVCREPLSDGFYQALISAGLCGAETAGKKKTKIKEFMDRKLINRNKSLSAEKRPNGCRKDQSLHTIGKE